MSIFSKFTETKSVSSTLISGDITIVLNFKPLSVKEYPRLSKMKDFDSGNSQEVFEAIDDICDMLAEKCLPIDGQKISKEDFLELSVDTILQIITDFTAGAKEKKETAEEASALQPSA